MRDVQKKIDDADNGSKQNRETVLNTTTDNYTGCN